MSSDEFFLRIKLEILTNKENTVLIQSILFNNVLSEGNGFSRCGSHLISGSNL
jgi:hypothetical protein